MSKLFPSSATARPPSASEATDDANGPGVLSRRFETYGDGKDLATLRSGGTRDSR